MFYLFLFAHLVADFALQPFWLVLRKRHWDGLPDGHTRATVLELPARPVSDRTDRDQPGSMTELLSHRRVAGTAVAKRPLSDYAITGAGA